MKTIFPSRYFFLSREGIFWLFLSCAMLVTGLVKSINLITLLAGFMLGMLVLNLILARWQLARLKGRRLVEGPIFAQTPSAIFMEVENPGRSDALGIFLLESWTALDQESGGRKKGSTVGVQGELEKLSSNYQSLTSEMEAEWFIPRISARQHLMLGKDWIARGRGKKILGPTQVRCGHPLGLVKLHRALIPAQEIIVLPRLGQIQRGVLRRFLAQASPTLGQARAFPRRHPSAQTEFHGLREFRTGDSPRWIHWRTTARRGELMIREFEDMPLENLVLVVEPLRSGFKGGQSEASSLKEEEIMTFGNRPLIPDPGVELAISLAATICWEWCRQKGDRLVLALANGHPEVVSGNTGRDLALDMLEKLALEQGCMAANYSLLLDRLGEVELPPGPVLVVSTQESMLANFLNQSLHRPVAAANLAFGEHSGFFEFPQGVP